MITIPAEPPPDVWLLLCPAQPPPPEPVLDEPAVGAVGVLSPPSPPMLEPPEPFVDE